MKNALLTLTALLIASSAAVSARADQEVKMVADKIQFLYLGADGKQLKEFSVKAGEKIKISFENPADSVNLQPHNLLIVNPGKLQVVGIAANNGLTDPDFITKKQCVPDDETARKEILHHTNVIKPGETATLEFTIEKPGDYIFMCTYPGHWPLMNGVMKVTG